MRGTVVAASSAAPLACVLDLSYPSLRSRCAGLIEMPAAVKGVEELGLERGGSIQIEISQAFE